MRLRSRRLVSTRVEVPSTWMALRSHQMVMCHGEIGWLRVLSLELLCELHLPRCGRSRRHEGTFATRARPSHLTLLTRGLIPHSSDDISIFPSIIFVSLPKTLSPTWVVIYSSVAQKGHLSLGHRPNLAVLRPRRDPHMHELLFMSLWIIARRR